MSTRYRENENHYLKLKEYSFKDFEKLDDHERDNRYTVLSNYCSTKISEGNSKFLREGFELLKNVLEKEQYRFFYKGGFVRLADFREFVIYCIALKRYDEVERVIAEYGTMLEEDIRNDAIGISKAELYFARREYDKLDVKYIYAKVFYEKGNYDMLNSLLDTFKHYIKSEKFIPEIVKENHTKFLNYTSRLAKMKSTGMQDGLYALKNEISENKNMHFTYKLWLLEKAEELEVQKLS
jgi:hypothetical protein